MAAKTFATYLSELTEVTALGSGDKLPVLESSTVKYVDGGDIGGGGALTVVAKTEDFTADGASGTVYTNEGAAGHIMATLEDSPVGTEYTFVSIDGNLIKVVPRG